MSGSEYFDLALDDYDINTVPRMSIIRVNGSFEIPEEFDMFSVAQKFMPLITSQIETTERIDGSIFGKSFCGYSNCYGG